MALHAATSRYLHIRRAIANSGMFDADWYLTENNLRWLPKKLALDHYVLVGETRRFHPSTSFDPNLYLALHEDVRKAKFGPLTHYALHGRAESRQVDLNPLKADTSTTSDYQSFLASQKPHPFLETAISRDFNVQTSFSVIIPVYKIETHVIVATLESLVAQSYNNWQACIAIACHDDPALIHAVTSFSKRDSRFKHILVDNSGIAGNSNAALALATGDFSLLLDHDDILPTNALFCLAFHINTNSDVDFIYTDKDMLSEDGSVRHSPLFKPAWSPETMLSANYATHLNAIRTSLLRSIGGWRTDVDGAQDWDLFLRVYGSSDRIQHIPKVLYSWRQVATSVSGTNGIASKPWALDAQLRSINRHLANYWPGATALFESDSFIRIHWSEAYLPSVLVVLLGSTPNEFQFDLVEAQKYKIAVIGSQTPNCLPSLMSQLADHDHDVVVFLDGKLSLSSGFSIIELVGPLQNPEIGVVGGQTLDERGCIYDGWITFDGGELRNVFKGLGPFHYSVMGSAAWYRNASLVSASILACRRSLALEALSAAAHHHHRADVQICLTARKQALRILHNPFCKGILSTEPAISRTYRADKYKLSDRISLKDFFRNGDPYLNPNVTLSDSNDLVVRADSAAQAQGRFAISEDAMALVAAYDIDLNLPQSSNAIEPRADRAVVSGVTQSVSVMWMIPEFETPFYGGMMTILRLSDHLRRSGVRQVFACLGNMPEHRFRSLVAQAFPDLSNSSDYYCVTDANDTVDLPAVSSTICTLWTTAYLARNFTRTRRKYYLVQDYESLFYPAGSISALVDAIYRFGFYGICNTITLAQIYRQFGGSASHFEPAVDDSVFYPPSEKFENNRTLKLFCYARPGHPRNCFETWASAIKQIKSLLGERVHIFTAGAKWDPAQYGLDGALEHLGLLQYKETGALYRSVDVGLVGMATAHPSYLPFELMACGAVVITNKNRYTDWLFEDKFNSILCEMTPKEILRAVELCLDPALRRELRSGGYRTISGRHSGWGAACSKFETILRDTNGLGEY